MTDLDSTTPPTPKHPLHAIVDVAVWLWPRRRLLVAELRAAQARQRAARPGGRPPQRLRFAVR